MPNPVYLAFFSCQAFRSLDFGRFPHSELRYNGSVSNLAMNKIMVAMSDEMVKALDQERKARKLESIPEAVRAVLGEYFKTKQL
jgi:hypothetical protein